MRLIDADELSKRLIDSIEYLKNQHYETYASVGDSIKFVIDNQQTAYSVDEVVEELKERTDFLKDCTKYGNKNAKQQSESYSTMMMYEVADLVDDLIEIVKQGSVPNDVCEWTQSGDMAISPHTFSKYKIKQWDGLYALNICPHCRKQIKVVE